MPVAQTLMHLSQLAVLNHHGARSPPRLPLPQFATGMVRDYRRFDANQEDTDEPGGIWRVANRGHALLLGGWC